MKKIPEYFKAYSYDFELIERVKDFALYSQSKDNKIYAYEVHKIRKHKKDKDFVGAKKGDEYLAGTSEFGMYAWTFPKLATAYALFCDLTKKGSPTTLKQ